MRRPSATTATRTAASSAVVRARAFAATGSRAPQAPPPAAGTATSRPAPAPPPRREPLVGRRHLLEAPRLDLELDGAGPRERDDLRELRPAAPVREDPGRLRRNRPEAHGERAASDADDRDVAARP